MKKKLFFVIFFIFFSHLAFGGILSFESGMHYEYLSFDNYNNYDNIKRTQFTIPSFGFSIGGRTPGWHLRFKINGSFRDFDIPLRTDYKKDVASTIRGVLGIQWIFNKQSGFYPFVFTGLQYRSSMVKFEYTPAQYAYGYYLFKKVSIPFSVGVFYYITNSITITTEFELDGIPIYSHFQEKVERVIEYEAQTYTELGASFFISIGVAY